MLEGQKKVKAGFWLKGWMNGVFGGWEKLNVYRGDKIVT